MNSLNDLLKLRNVNPSNSDGTPWTIKESSYGGRGLFAVKDIAAGQLIFKDFPAVIGPRMSDQTPGCSVCLIGNRPLVACPDGCGLPICHGHQCEHLPVHKDDCTLMRKLAGNATTDPAQWSPQLYKALGLLRCLNMSQKDQEIVRLLYASKDRDIEIQISQLKDMFPNGITEEDEKWLLHCCGVLNGTAFEVPHSKGDGNWSLRGLYPLAAVMNHCCSPNTRHIYAYGLNIEEGFGPIMSVVASVDIPKNTEITTTYCPQLWSTPARRQFLLITKQFLCTCFRCQDPTEFGTYLSALKCPCNKGVLTPVHSLELDSAWVCNSCSRSVEAKKALAVQTLATKLPLVERCVLLPPTNYLILQAKLDSVWKSAKNISSLSISDLLINENNIRDLLKVLKQLRLGKSRMSGLLLMELHKTIDELVNKNYTNTQHTDELIQIWNEANSILEGDLLAPKIRGY